MKFFDTLIIFFILNLFIFITDKINLFKFIVDNPDNFRKFHKKKPFSGWYNSIYKYFLFCNFKF